MAAHGFHMQVVTGRLRPLDQSLPLIAAVLEAGVDSVRLRDSGDGMKAAIRELKLVPEWDVDRIVVTGEPRVAGMFGLRWLHLPSHWLDQTPPFAKFGRIGISVHSLEEAIEAEALGADYLVFGHIHATSSHPGAPGQGIAALAEIVERIELPVLAIGGINHANVNEVLATGCAGVSVVSAIADHPDPGEAARRLLAAIASTNAEPRLRLEPLPTSMRKGSSH